MAMSEEEKMLAHLQMIQAVIERMGRNSFHVKTWSAALATGWLALVPRGDTPAGYPGWLVLLPFLLLAALDGYYLWQERLFRRLYDEVRQSETSDFAMDTSRGSVEVRCWNALFSRTVLAYHLAIIAILILVVLSEVLNAQGVL